MKKIPNSHSQQFLQSLGVELTETDLMSEALRKKKKKEEKEMMESQYNNVYHYTIMEY